MAFIAFILLVTLYSCGPSSVTVSARPEIPVRVRPAAPRVDYVWVDGEWYRSGGNYIYRDGYWSRPRGHRVWHTGEWHQRGNGWYWRKGRWH
jgi:hypothetical protein